MYVPVVDSHHTPLMPTTPSRARRWIKTRKATPFWDHGLWCVRLNVAPAARLLQPVAVGLDPGSKREAYTIKSAAHTYLNIEAETPAWVKEHVKTRREMRRTRRYRKTPCRANRHNRTRGGLPPSTKARWQWKLRVCRWLDRLYPITAFVVEDISTETRPGKRRWNGSFSPLEVGKLWFYTALGELHPLVTRDGWDTKRLRDALGLHKSKAKLSGRFEAHCIDSWALANFYTGGHLVPDNTQMVYVVPLRFHRRQLHRLQPEPGGVRKPYGGTRSHGLTRGSLVQHTTLGLVYVGGWMKDRLSLHRMRDGKRLTQTAKPADCRFRAYNSWRTTLAPR